MKTWEELKEGIGGMTLKAHTEKTRLLKKKVDEHHSKLLAAQSEHGEAVRALEAHRMQDPKYKAKKENKYKDDRYHEVGRDREPATPYG